MTELRGEGTPSRAKLAAAFAAVYLIWGSTYLAIRFGIETLPPFLMAGVRFLVAGGLLYGWVRLKGARRPTRQEWAATTTVGALLLLCGNGAVVWAEQRVPSGIAALIVAIVPFWMVLFEWLRPGGIRPTFRVIVGLVLGFAGLALLVGPGGFGGQAVDGVGAAVLAFGSFAWAGGSIYSRGARLPASPLLATAMEMLAGGVLLTLASLFAGEGSRVALEAISLRSVGAVLYLIAFGSLVGYTAYVWLLKVSTPARVSTYAYVNPVVAVLLGWAIADEPLTPRVLVAAAVIIGAVGVITMARPARAGESMRPRPARRKTGRSEPEEQAA